MKVVHLSMTPLAGAPIRLVQALNEHTAVQARLVNLNPRAYGNRVFDEDLDFRSDREQALDLLEDADLVHCHHWMDLRVNPFGVDLSHKCVIRQFHSEPAFVAHHAGVSVDAILGDSRPQLVVAQFHERLYRRARPVPNLINFHSIDTAVAAAADGPAKPQPVVSFAPTVPTPAGADRWNTKGAPETLALLDRLAAEHSFGVDAFENLPHQESLVRKARADLVIDEMVTGSYHLSGLEALALGKPTFGYLDARMVAVVAQMCASESLPWINVHLGALPDILPDLVREPSLRAEVGRQSARWMREHWAPQRMSSHFLAAYEDALNGMTELRRSPVHGLQDLAVPDLHWLRLTRQLY